MSAIVPSILVKSRTEIEEKVAVVRGLVDTVQIDVVDGVLAGPPTWPYAEGGLNSLREGFDIHDFGDMRYEIDLMVREPRSAMRTFLHAGAGRIVLHAESSDNLSPIIDELEKNYGRDKDFAPELLSLGLSMRIETSLKQVESYLPRVDYVQFMGIAEIGRQGIPFDPRVLKRIQEFRHSFPEIPVQVDGGVSLENAHALFSAGASRLVVGSALWKSESIEGTLRTLTEIAQEHQYV